MTEELQKHRRNIYLKFVSKENRQEFNRLFGNSKVAILEVLNRLIDLSFYNQKKYPEHEGWLFATTKTISNGLYSDKQNRTISRALKKLQNEGYIRCYYKNKQLEHCRRIYPGLDKLLTAYPSRSLFGDFNNPNYIYVNFNAIKGPEIQDTPEDDTELTPKEKYNYYEGMEKLRNHEAIKQAEKEYCDKSKPNRPKEYYEALQCFNDRGNYCALRNSPKNPLCIICSEADLEAVSDYPILKPGVKITTQIPDIKPEIKKVLPEQEPKPEPEIKKQSTGIKAEAWQQ